MVTKVSCSFDSDATREGHFSVCFYWHAWARVLYKLGHYVETSGSETFFTLAGYGQKDASTQTWLECRADTQRSDLNSSWSEGFREPCSRQRKK